MLAFALRCWQLGAPSFWYDEAYSWWVGARLSAPAALASSLAETIPPLSYLLWRGWSALVGETEFALRYSSTLAGLLAVAAGGRCVRRLTGREVGGLAALGLLAIAPPLIWASRELRMYAPALTLTLLAGMALLEVLESPVNRRWWAWAWGALTLGALYTLVLSGFWLVGQGLFTLAVLLRRPPAERRSLIAALSGPAALAALLYLPWMLPALGALGANHGYWPGHLTAEWFFVTAFQAATVFDFITPEPLARALAGLVLIMSALALLLTRRRPLAALYPLCYALPALLLLYAIYRDVPKWGLRHAVIFAPAPYLALAGAWGVVAGWPPSRRRRAALLGLGVATTLVSAPLLWADANLLTGPAFANDDWRGLARYVEAQRAPGDLVILQTGAIFPTWYYYADAENVLRLPDDDLLDINHVQHYANTAPVLNQHLHAGMEVWLVEWLADVTDPTGITAALLHDIGEEWPTPAFHGLGLRRFRITRTPDFPTEPPVTLRLDLELLPGISLWGVTLPEAPTPADRPLRLRTWWMTDRPATHTDRFYQASLRVHDAEGHLWARLDEPPGGGDYRPDRWPPNTPVLGPFDIILPPGTPPGAYALSLVLYEGHTTHTLDLGTVDIARPARRPELPAGITPAHHVSGAAPLRLLGTGLNQPTVRPCETLYGRTFWEVTSALTTTLTTRIGLGAKAVTLTLPPGDVAQWQPGDRFATPFALPIACRALALEAPLSVALSNSAETALWHGPPARIDAPRAFEVPAGIHSAPANDFGFAQLRGYRLEPERITAGQPFTLTLYWQAVASTDATYTAFVHVTPPNVPAPIIAQNDAWPAQGARPTFTWIPGEVIADAHPLPRLPAGTYALRVGLYGADGVRAPLTGDLAFDAALLLTNLMVK